MFRRSLFLTAAVVALLGVLAGHGLLEAQTRKPASTSVKPKPSAPKSPHKVLPHKVPPHKVPPHKVPPHKVPPHKVPPHKVPPHKIPPHKIPPHKIPPHHPEGHKHGPERHRGEHWKDHRGEHSWDHRSDRTRESKFVSTEWRERFSARFFAAGFLFSGVSGVPGVGFLPTGVPTGIPMGGSGGSSATSSGSSEAPADTADILRAYAGIIKANEEARILREEAEGMRLDNLKKKAETRAYLESLTPSWTEKQAKIDKQVLAHAQGTTNLFEIASGKPLNIMLADLRKVGGRNVVSSSSFLGEEVLGRINITTKNGNLGLLRNEGVFTWPQALTREDIVSEEDRGVIKVLARALIRSKGNFPGNMLEDLDSFLVRTEAKLAKKVNDMPADQYLQAKRFLNDFQAARIALENGEGAAYFKFQKWVRGGKSIQEVADYMVREGVEFASAVAGDEAAYRAVHSALASYDVAVNTRSAGSMMSSNQ